MVICLELLGDLEKMAQELRDVSDVGNDAQSDNSSRQVNPRLRKTQIQHFLFDVLHTALTERYQKLKDARVIPIRDGKALAANDQADGFFDLDLG